MKKLLFVALLTFIGNSLFAQKTVSTNGTEYYSCSQKNGMTSIPGDYKLTVQYDEKELGFNASGGQRMTSFSTVKKTDKYVIGQNVEGNYAFFDITKKQFYYIDYFMKRYLTTGYGSQSAEIKQNTMKIMDILKKGESQKDAIQYLIKQTEYGF
ncbi:MAG: hypothetical protein KDC90_09955 [Ignavibacteriae bacterium]|nr:hypothetical protein [Ignavibacteriota bacterium]